MGQFEIAEPPFWDVDVSAVTGGFHIAVHDFVAVNFELSHVLRID